MATWCGWRDGCKRLPKPKSFPIVITSPGKGYIADSSRRRLFSSGVARGTSGCNGSTTCGRRGWKPFIAFFSAPRRLCWQEFYWAWMKGCRRICNKRFAILGQRTSSPSQASTSPFFPACLPRCSPACLAAGAARWQLHWGSPFTPCWWAPVIWDVGFQLSFMATLGLVLYAEPLSLGFIRLASRRVPQLWAARAAQPVGEYFLFTLAAQATTLPIILHHFQRLSLISLLANPLILPVQPAVMVFSGLAM